MTSKLCRSPANPLGAQNQVVVVIHRSCVVNLTSFTLLKVVKHHPCGPWGLHKNGRVLKDDVSRIHH